MTITAKQQETGNVYRDDPEQSRHDSIVQGWVALLEISTLKDVSKPFGQRIMFDLQRPEFSKAFQLSTSEYDFSGKTFIKV